MKKTTAKTENQATVQAEETQLVTPFGSTIELLCKTPDLNFDDLLKKLTALKIDVKANKSPIRTGYSQARRIFTELRKNGLMN